MSCNRVWLSEEVLQNHRAEAASLGIWLRPAIFLPERNEALVVKDEAEIEDAPVGRSDLTSLDTLFLRTSEGAQGVFQVHRVSWLTYLELQCTKTL